MTPDLPPCLHPPRRWVLIGLVAPVYLEAVGGRRFDGVGRITTDLYNAFMSFARNSYTIEAWVRLETLATGTNGASRQYLVMKKERSSGDDETEAPDAQALEELLAAVRGQRAHIVLNLCRSYVRCCSQCNADPGLRHAG